MEIRFNQDITARNTFGMRVSAACVAEYGSAEELAELYAVHIPSLPRPLLHIGGGSNLLFTGDFPGTLLHSRIVGIAVEDGAGPSCGDEVYVRAGSGVLWDDFCAWASEKELWGTENLSAIPGEVGAAAVQNIGAYGTEVKDIIYKVNCFDTVRMREVSFPASECGYGYRDSLFKRDRKGRYIVLSVVFRLGTAPAPKLGYGHIRTEVEAAFAAAGKVSPRAVRETIVKIRESKLPDVSVVGSAGSFYKNPVVPKSAYDKVLSIARAYNGEDCIVPHFDAGSGFVKIPAAWLIEQCGWKGVRRGNAGVYEKQPLVLINATGQASPDEIIALHGEIAASVKEKFDIQLVPEVEFV